MLVDVYNSHAEEIQHFDLSFTMEDNFISIVEHLVIEDRLSCEAVEIRVVGDLRYSAVRVCNEWRCFYYGSEYAYVVIPYNSACWED